MPPLGPTTSRIKVVIALVAVWVLWGSVYLAIRLVILEVDPFQAMSQRFLFASLVLMSVVLARRGLPGLRVTRRHLMTMVVLGVLLLGIGNCLQALAQVKGLPSGVTALVVASVPAWAVLLRLLTRDRPPAVTMLGVVIGFAGIIVLVALGRAGETAMPLIGVVLVLVASLSWTIGSFLQGMLPLPADVVTIAAYQQLVAASCSALLAVMTGEHFSMKYSLRGAAALIYLVLACSVVGYLAFTWLLTHVPLSLTATHAYVNPVVAVVLGWIVLAEPIGAPILIGGGVVVAAVALIVSAERGRRTGVAIPDAGPHAPQPG